MEPIKMSVSVDVNVDLSQATKDFNGNSLAATVAKNTESIKNLAKENE